MPKIVFPVGGKQADQSRGSHEKADVVGFVPHFWFVQETTDTKLVNMKKDTVDIKITIDGSKHTLAIPLLVNTQTLEAGCQLYMKKASVLVSSSKKPRVE